MIEVEAIGASLRVFRTGADAGPERIVPVATEQEATERAAVIREAKTWLRTPYHPGAHIKGAGIDCGWLMKEVFERLGLIEHVEPGYYPPDFALHSDSASYQTFVERFAAPVQEPTPGDVVMFKWGHSYSHGGIIIDWPNIVHASLSDRMCCLADARRCHRLMTFKDGNLRPHIFYSRWAK